MRTHYVIKVDSEHAIEAAVYPQFAAALQKALHDMLADADSLRALCKTPDLLYAHSEAEIKFTDAGHIAATTLVSVERADGKVVSMAKTPISDALKANLPFAVKVTKNQLSQSEVLSADAQ